MASAQSRAPASLDETLQWMADFYRAHGGGIGLGAIWVDMTLDRVSRCDILVRSKLLPLDRTLYGMDSFHLARLSNLSPRVLVVKAQPMTRVEAELSRPGGRIRSVITLGSETDPDSMTQRLPFVFSAPEDAQRFARALQHAIRLCGGREAPF
jgi:hypothetical protein